MTERPIIDAGPGLNFLSIGKERLLIEVLGPLSTPETVRDEMMRKAERDSRFQRVGATLPKLVPRWLEVLSDNRTSELDAVVSRMTQVPMETRQRNSKDLGETMVVAHAVVAAEAGKEVTVLMDDGQGIKMAVLEIRRIERLRAGGRPVGNVRLVKTETVLQRAAGGPHIPDRGAMRSIYTQKRGLDDGLPPIDSTYLLSPATWSTRVTSE
ncbi:PIN domain-containing protein [Actinokineospora bangkokensis]|uniref:Uncharacterized protein n=1 Tax=Actinokineospora bangkokensis TaxID=1193682 RepID=A0A1Q9LGX0_9PSEU|nr:hypothetical protein [Actinokineospora bangkokensis]OLR91266.1 hypothetical protein BJP25_26720 [Actinokineospora bangkokensis]